MPPVMPATQKQRDVALHHADIIEQRKRVEKDVLDAIIDLMDFPEARNADPQRPSPADALRFREAVAIFQPSDYDALIEERNIAAKCGYALCPRPKRKAPSAARKHFIDTSKGVEIVDRRVLEVWCCDDCARRALFVKVQLSEEPAWLRQGGFAGDIELMVENAGEHPRTLPLRLKGSSSAPPKPADVEEHDAALAWQARDDALADLAVERGEKPGRLSKANRELVQDKIRERVATKAPEPPSLPTHSSHMAIEGHVPRTSRNEDDDEDDDGQDWDKHLPG